jgi:hypothetical protein
LFECNFNTPKQYGINRLLHGYLRSHIEGNLPSSEAQKLIQTEADSFLILYASENIPVDVPIAGVLLLLVCPIVHLRVALSSR